MSTVDQHGAIKLLVAALGGEGGGVLTQWLLDAAEASGWYGQSTSLAGVAQRTGATIYYLEFMPRLEGQPQPVMSLFPAQGDIDIAVTSEAAEAGRMLSRGFISPDRTTLITSSHRVFGITEKSATTDGTIDPADIALLCERYAQRLVQFDMAEVVQRHGTVISAALLGAIAGAEVLPFDKSIFVELLTRGRGADANLAAFEECFDRARSHGVAQYEPEPAPSFVLPQPTTALGQRLLPKIADFPEPCHEVLYHAVQRLIDYQDSAYAEQFLAAVADVRAVDTGEDDYALTREAGRWLALWMAFEDIPRVAQLKLRPSRDADIRAEVRASGDQLIQVSEFFHPRVEEVAAVLPAALGRWLLNSSTARRSVAAMLGPRTLRTDRISVSLMLRALAAMRRWRRGSLGYAHEWGMISRWLKAVIEARDPASARALADCARMVKGYGDTRHRGCTRLMAIVEKVEQGVAPAAVIKRLYAAAIEGEDGVPFQQALEHVS